MIIFGKIRGAIIAVDTSLKGFCLKCDQITGLIGEVYKPTSRKVLLEKSRCKRCYRIKRNYRKFVAFSPENYQQLAHFGKARTYSKMAWSTLAPEVGSLIDIKPSQVRSMEASASYTPIPNTKLNHITNDRLDQVAIGNDNIQIGGNTSHHKSPYTTANTPWPMPQQQRYHVAGQPNMPQPNQNMSQAQQPTYVLCGSRHLNPQNYHYPSCRCNHCLDLDRERRGRGWY